MSRDAFLSHVRRAAAAGRTYRIHARHDITRAMGYADHCDDLVAEYVSEVAKAGGDPVVVASHAAACEEIAGIFRQYEPRSALCWRHPVLDRLRLAEFLARHNVERIDSAELSELPFDDRRGRILAADIGITSAAYAVAETGSLVMAHDRGNERVASLLPPVFIAVVERGQIVADLFDAFDRFAAQVPGDLPSNITLITGPSKTGDIESKLVTGVHGPGKWHVVIVDA